MVARTTWLRTAVTLAYTTVATLVRILEEKGFLELTHDERPFRYQPVKTFEEARQSALRSDAAGVRRLAGAVAHSADGPEETHRQRATVPRKPA
ncbi:MAG: BlaI/MecI/CopY family transcriptional regulator [Planctomycetaceae bacterium]